MEAILKHEPKEASPTIVSYLERKGVTGIVTEILLYQGQRISREDTKDSEILVTEKLNGCTAIAVWTNESAQLSHFPPFMLEKHLDVISTLLTKKDIDSPEKHALVYMSSKRTENEDKIVEYLKNKIGEEIDVTIKYYDSLNDKDSEYLALELKPNHVVVVHHGEDYSLFE